MPAKLDLKKERKHLYRPSAKKCAFVDVPAMNYLVVDGAGDPNTSPEFQAATEALYAVSYALKFAIKKGESAIDYTVMPLEGLWWSEDMVRFSVEDKSDWFWTLMIRQPDFVTAEQVDAAMQQAAAKKDLPAVDRLRFEVYKEGLSAQIMHIGPYAAEAPSIAALHAFIAESGHHLRGKHHEIYLSDPRRAALEKMKTIIRQPVASP